MSEPETLALHKHIKTIRPELLSAISVHSYGKDIYYPKVGKLLNHHLVMMIVRVIWKKVILTRSEETRESFSEDSPAFSTKL